MAKPTIEKDRVKGKKKRKKNKANQQKKPQNSKSVTTTPTSSTSSSNTPNTKNKEQTLSLASRLKKQRGTAATTPLPPEWSRIRSLDSSSSSSSSSSIPKFLSPEKDGDKFIDCMEECYRGFKYEQPNELPSAMHEQFTSSFHAMNDSGLFLYDVVQPGGKRLSLTFVTRTLVGNPGSTYKYLGLRLFSHPWCDVDDNGDGDITSTNQDGTGKTLRTMGYSSKCTKALITMGAINQHLTERTNDVLQEDIAPHVKNGLVGSAEYSLTLINRMEPTSVKKDLKKDNLHDMGKTSVSWHKDSGLQDFSSIAVYHTMQDLRSSDDSSSSSSSSPWKVALRVADSTSRTPALSVPLPSGSLYYLLDDFNHQHEHAVISGASKLRYSSTHRVARDGCGSWQYIRDKCKMILSSNICICTRVLRSKGDDTNTSINATDGGIEDQQRKVMNEAYGNTAKRKQLVKEFRACLHLMIELEFEWIRQWHIQGRHHAKLHKYWHKPMQFMMHSYQSLDKVVSCIVNNVLRQSSSKSKSKSKSSSISDTNTVACEDLYDVAIESAENVKKMRAAWELRLRDPIFATLPDDMKPFSCSTLDECRGTQRQPKDLRKWRGLFVRFKEEETTDSVGNRHGDGKGREKKSSSSSKKRKLKDNKSNLTKKERKKIASNWEKMKGKI